MSPTKPLAQRRLRGAQISKACDSCKSRKIRCSATVIEAEKPSTLSQDLAVDQCHQSKHRFLERPNDLLVDHILFGRSATSMQSSEQSFSLKSGPANLLIGHRLAHGKLADILSNDTAFSALYYSVLALGCLYDGGGSFEPGKGDAWDLFSVALALLPDLPKSSNSLVALQAMTTAAVYALGVPCLSIEQKIMTETARMVQDLAPTLSKGFSGPIFCRIFWVVYAIEKTSSFHFGRASVIIDANIMLPLPDIPESSFGNFSWMHIMARHCRLLSRAMDTLFCPGVCQKGSQYFLLVIDQLQGDLEDWMMSIPEDFRPKPSHQRHLLRRSIKGAIGIWINYLYYSLKLILLRSRLQINSHQDDDSAKGIYRDQLVDVSRSILEMVTYIDVEPSTPLCALFVLFDQVICNPKSPDTRSNLALLDIAGGHFARIEFASRGSLPGSLISEFTYIAREYVNQLGSFDVLDGSQFSLQATDQNIAPPVITDALGMPVTTSQNHAQRTNPTTVESLGPFRQNYGTQIVAGVLAFGQGPSFYLLTTWDSMYARAFGWYFQFLTVIGVATSLITFALGLAADLTHQDVLFRAKSAVTILATPLEVLITFLYWSIRSHDPTLLMSQELFNELGILIP
ncbi:hypothetical protein FHETE_10944 [Fusarium heterosporum]|uniref:Xylanolytic transcriptional activator regulatory domain-containing protein n=1 Tax=Fusarium heterosporum TaxID=42747 RepID=A0A8H5SMY8_FUSHE|nr:hypothetical protein FHETE_10944 [Fusarium heterosporum]